MSEGRPAEARPPPATSAEGPPAASTITPSARDFVDGIAENPKSVAGRSAQDIADQFSAADLEDLAAEYPVLVGLDFTPANIREIAEAVPSARGLALTLAERATRGDARFHTCADAVRAIEALNNTT